MLAYRGGDDRPCEPAAVVRALRARAAAAQGSRSHDEVRELFIELGELEAAVADWIFPERDGLHPLAQAFRTAALAAAHALVGSWKREPVRSRRALDELRQILGSIDPRQLPQTLSLRVSEGYAYYALYPETYAVAAERFASERVPANAVCIGIRSIGTSLSAAVAASLERLGVPVSLHSVRPHGHPFDRRIQLASELARLWGTQPADCHFLVVDEGPGLSGSSFTSVVSALSNLGIDSGRISLFPSWNADPAALRSEAARRVWGMHRRYTAGAGEAGLNLEAIAGAEGPVCVDFAAGAWRSHLLGDERTWPAVQPQHEVPKAWLPESGTIVRFAGLGRYGRAKLARAERLAGAGLGAAPEALAGGYLSLKFVPGTPCERASPELIDRIADHVAFLVRHFPAPRSPAVRELEEMIRTNMRLGLGIGPPDLTTFRAALADAPCAAIDGRMLPHEWIAAEGGFCKVDALDHHADHFFPGIQDAGWDLAAAAFEFRLDRAAIERLVTRYAAASGDRDVRARLPFYDLAYPAFRLGYATLARGSLAGQPDAARFERVISRSGERLRELASAAAAR